MTPSPTSPRRDANVHGLLLIDKPSGITSHDVVDEVRRILGTRRVGHAGTLDPIADGLLVVMVGEATKLAEYLQASNKQYEGSMRLGVESDTYDSQGTVVPGPGGPLPDEDRMHEIIDELTGAQEQVPPPFSAKKLGGKRLYEYARAGEKVEAPARAVQVMDFQILEAEGDRVDFGVEVTSGTYVRSLVHEFGRRAGCGAILTALRRTVSGQFDVEEAVTLDTLREKAGDPATLAECLRPMRTALPFPTAWLGAGAEGWLRRGQAIPFGLVEFADGQRPAKGARVTLCRVMGDAVAIARVDPAPLSPIPKALMGQAGPWLQPIKMLEPDTDGASGG